LSLAQQQEEILSHLEKILSSSVFRAADRVSMLLRFIVTETLQGRCPNEYRIAHDAFGKLVGFDPLYDSSVRSAMKNLRAKLAEYYRAEGLKEAIRIDVPKGAYTATFSVQASRFRQDVEIASVDDVLAWGWDGKRLLDELISLDHQTIEGMSELDEGRTEQWAPVFMDHPDTWRLLIERPGQIVGYWHFAPLFDEEFGLAKDGRLHDNQVTTDKVQPCEYPGDYNMYITIFCLKPKFRRPTEVTKLFDSFLEMLTDLARHGVFFREVCANAFSPSGVALCRNFGMTPVKPHVSRGVIYIKQFYPFPDHHVFNRNVEFVELYERHFTDPQKPL